MKKRILSDEQVAAAAARRERFRALSKQVAAMSDEQRAALLANVGAIVTCEGHPLSDVNSALLIFQRSDVSMVGGFRQWKKAGRYVRKGERALSIWIPKGSKAEADPDKRPGEISSRELAEAESGRSFLVGSVFDISQTSEVGSEESSGADEGEPAEASEVPASAVPAGSGVSLVPASVVASAWGAMPAWGAPAAPVEVLGPEVKTIWNSDGRSGPVLICAPPRAAAEVFTLEGGRE